MPRHHRRSRLRRAALLGAGSALLLSAGPASATVPVTSFQGETMTLSPAVGRIVADSKASGGKTLVVWANGAASKRLTTAEAADRVVIRVRGSQCKGAPVMSVRLDGRQVLKTSVSSRTYTEVAFGVSVPQGSRTLSVALVNDYRTSWCDRNLFVDRLTLTAEPQPTAVTTEPAPTVQDAPSPAPTPEPTSTPTTDSTAPQPITTPQPEPSTDPLAAATFYVDPHNAARQQADAWRSTRPVDAAHLDKIAAQAQAAWFGEWSGDIQASVSRRVEAAAAAGALPVLVAYNIPQRDCGSYSAGGLASADAYKSWIRSFATGIGTRSAVVILEPDALAMLDCLSSADQSTRLGLLKDAVAVLEAQPGVSVYLDAGHSSWIGAEQMALRLANAGVAQAQGFAVNVSNFRLTTELVAYGKNLSSRVGGKHFVVDTSRNGLGPGLDGQWCNPSGRALGTAPTTSTADAAVDAYLWIKNPGESDGTCNGGPSAGVFWADYALGLAQRAG